ncbi:MAG: aldo/keto reductase [Gammaproteobacteria bacterium]|nr:MAG: aldo/keto reductase [Gammaproteobacteria bacterium]
MSWKDTDPTRRRLLKLIGALPLVAQGVRAATAGGPIRKPIPSSGETLPVIGLGTSRVFDVSGSGAALDGLLEVLAALAAFDNAMIDTSPMYGEAERVVGELLPRLNRPVRFFLATKVWTRGREAGIAQMDRSFRLLGAKVIDLMQIHNLLDWRTHIGTLREWKAAGRIRYLGITHYREDAHDDLMRVMRELPDLDFLQVNYSLLEPAAERRLLPLARERGVAVIANRPFGRGAWFRRTRGRPLPEWVQEAGIGSWAQFALKWIVSHPAITCAIPATAKARHMLDNLQAARGSLPDEAMRRRMRELARTL